MLDRVMMRLQDIRREGAGFFSRWARERVELELIRMEHTRNMARLTGEQFHNSEIEAAFIRALWRYHATYYDGDVLLLRPKPHIAYKLSEGRQLTTGRHLVKADNGWSPYVRAMLIKEVPGNHDSMVLEPSVRVLATHMRQALSAANGVPSRQVLAAEKAVTISLSPTNLRSDCGPQATTLATVP